jgi:hypothetical protein
MEEKHEAPLSDVSTRKLIAERQCVVLVEQLGTHADRLYNKSRRLQALKIIRVGEGWQWASNGRQRRQQQIKIFHLLIISRNL